jgi:hypothetical protein
MNRKSFCGVLITEGTFLLETNMQDKVKEAAIVDLIKNRQDLNYVQICLYANCSLTAIKKTAKDNNCQRIRGAKKKRDLLQQRV